MHYNTTNKTGEALKNAQQRTLSQEEKIMNFARSTDMAMFSPSLVCQLVFSIRTPLTSVRRAMTDLTSKGLLEKTSHQTEGLYGEPEYCWKLKREGKLL